VAGVDVVYKNPQTTAAPVDAMVRWSFSSRGNAGDESVKLLKVRLIEPVVVIGMVDCNELLWFVR
jgi:hypothetical protein